MTMQTAEHDVIVPRSATRNHRQLENLPLMIAVVSAFVFVGTCIAVLG